MSHGQRELRIVELLGDALERQGEARRKFLDRECADDAELRQELETLLAEETEATGEFLETPPFERTGPTSTSETTTVLPIDSEPTRPLALGPFRVVETLGQGSMGTVYLGEQEEPVRRQVALKVADAIHDRRRRRRFAAECQALARLAHPNIAALYAVDRTAQGHPYVAMELLDEADIIAWCDKHTIDLEGRLELFRGVCAGIGHAHEKGILHRDLKPSNILVTEVDQKPVAKVIDFGIARALDEPLLAGTRMTLDHQIIGSPAYMSPEAASFDARDLDTRSDVYSLGLVLYELLVGALPFDLERQTLASHLRRLAEEDLPSPSARFAGLEADQRRQIADRRGLAKDALTRRLRGDLDAIIAKATAREREDRYGSPAELAADLARHADNKPITAQPHSTWYRIGKFTRRHRTGVAAVALATVALIGGFVATSLALVRARQAESEALVQRQQARLEAQTSRRVIDFLLGMFQVADPRYGDGDNLTAREILDEGADRIQRGLETEPQVQATLKEAIGQVYASVGLYDQAEPLLEEALRARQQQLAENDPGLGTSLHELAKLYVHQARFDDAEPLVRRALALRRQRSTESVEVADTLVTLGRLLFLTSRLDESASRLDEALAIYRRQLGGEHRKVGETLELYGSLLVYRQQPESARFVLSESLAMMTRLLDAEHPRVAEVRSSLAWALTKAGKPADAEVELRESLATLDRQQVDYPSLRYKHLILLTDALIEQEKIDQGARLAGQAVDLARRTFPEGHWGIHSAEAAVASCRWRRGDFI
ncbi:MAG: serine/threonine-protein kinase, partial [Acidobacteriota bacterium]